MIIFRQDKHIELWNNIIYIIKDLRREDPSGTASKAEKSDSVIKRIALDMMGVNEAIEFPMSGCYACDYTRRINGSCKDCPLENMDQCVPGSIYEAFTEDLAAGKYDLAIKAAEEIRDQKVKDGVPTMDKNIKTKEEVLTTIVKEIIASRKKKMNSVIMSMSLFDDISVTDFHWICYVITEFGSDIKISSQPKGYFEIVFHEEGELT